MRHDPLKLTLGRGEVYFDRFAEGTRVGEGERYLGNTPSFQITRSIKRSERKAAFRGRKHEAMGSPQSESLDIQITTDHMSSENLAMWYSNSPDHFEVRSVERSESLVLRRGLHYQLGKHLAIGGVRNLTGVEVDVGGEGVEWEVDRKHGRIRLGPGYPEDQLAVYVSYYHAEGAQGVVLPSAKDLLGALRIVGKEGRGPVTSIYFPMVSIRPDAAVDLKSSEFRQMRFSATALKRSPEMPLAYVLHDQEKPLGWTG